MKCAQVRRAARGEDVGGRHGGTKRQRISNLGKTWQKYCGKQIRGGDVGREPRSRIHGDTEKQIGKLVCWDGDGRRLDRWMTS